MREKNLYLSIGFFILSGITLTFYYVFFDRVNIDLLNILAIFAFISLTINLFYAFRNVGNNIVFFTFQITFFTFLIGEVFFGLLNYKFINLNGLPPEAYKHSLLSIVMSLWFLLIGHYFVKRKIRKTFIDNYNLISKDSINIKKIRIISGVLYLICFIAQAVILKEKSAFVSTNGYIDYYSNYTSKLPFIFSGMASIYYISLYVFLSTLPSKKTAYPVIGMSIFNAILSLGFGQRNGFVLDILIIIIYLTLRNRIVKKERSKDYWITKKQVFIILCLLPIVISILFNIGNQRLGKAGPNLSTSEKVQEFFTTQGGSIQVIAYGYEYKDKIPQKDTIYTLGPLTTYFSQNIVSRTIFGFEDLDKNLLDKATKSSLYSPALSYLLFPDGYLQGKGMGSSYIAELYQDFGYFGIAIGSLFLGIILGVCDGFPVKRWWSFALLLFVTKEIIYLPRAGALEWLSQVFSLPNFLALIFIGVMAHILKSTKLTDREINYTSKLNV
ncbi:O-antigen polysaccharide polymerase Wzy family protein [Priestia aryabhattai]|uniref:O-antigen polysaccharide polymerase Wzy family protein n=1 Tax=Priestia aryabhattai TaxID=412384 RepID=UPI001C8DD061|nr:O-antigen polysaccharide polymerase Wzy family protein [Priestia aryabhattai]MBX9998583.1 O-antigen polysaccharide polymerase Wzy family protein [Priestia aryabhattai]